MNGMKHGGGAAIRRVARECRVGLVGFVSMGSATCRPVRRQRLLAAGRNESDHSLR